MPNPPSIRTKVGFQKSVNSLLSVLSPLVGNSKALVPYRSGPVVPRSQERRVVAVPRRKPKRAKAFASTPTPGSVDVVAAPTSFGVCMNSAIWARFSGKPLNNREHEPGERFVGSGIFHYSTTPTYVGNTGNTLIQTPGVSGGTDQNMFNDTGTSDTNYIRRLSPGALGDRPRTIASIYAYSAIRKLVLKWIPRVSTATSGMITFGILRNGYLLTNAMGAGGNDNYTSCSGIMNLVPSAMAPIWEPCSLEYSYAGDHLFPTGLPASGGTTAVDQNYAVQGGLAVAGQALANSSTFGMFMADYIIDFYDPCPTVNQANVGAPVVESFSNCSVSSRAFSPVPSAVIVPNSRTVATRMDVDDECKDDGLSRKRDSSRVR